LKLSRGVTAETHELSDDRRPIRPPEFFPESPQDVSRGEVALLNRKLGARLSTARIGAISDDVHVPVNGRDQELVDRRLTAWRCQTGRGEQRMRLDASRPEQDVVRNRPPVLQAEATSFNAVNPSVRPNTNPEPRKHRFSVEPRYRREAAKNLAVCLDEAHSTPAESPNRFCRRLDTRRTASDDDEIPAFAAQAADGLRKPI
jgi:hypothetical protein